MYRDKTFYRALQSSGACANEGDSQEAVKVDSLEQLQYGLVDITVTFLGLLRPLFHAQI